MISKQTTYLLLSLLLLLTLSCGSSKEEASDEDRTPNAAERVRQGSEQIRAQARPPSDLPPNWKELCKDVTQDQIDEMDQRMEELGGKLQYLSGDDSHVLSCRSWQTISQRSK